LGDGLTGGDGERRILISELPQTLGDKSFSRHISQSTEDRFATDTPRSDLFFDRVVAKLRKINHPPIPFWLDHVLFTQSTHTPNSN
jgi:hypothetical protein